VPASVSLMLIFPDAGAVAGTGSASSSLRVRDVQGEGGKAGEDKQALVAWTTTIYRRM
jgi:hypothetical protein